MAKAFNQKTKILYLLQMLTEQTDETHVLNMQEILTALEEKEIRAERKSIYDDIDVLRNFGYDICFRKGQPSGYYMGKRTFDVKEVQMLIDLLPEDENAEQIEQKLKGLLSKYQAEEVHRQSRSEQNAADAKAEEAKNTETEEKKERVQLLFKEKHMAAVQAYPGCDGDIKEHKSGLYKAWVDAVVDGEFYGWLVSQGFGIKIVKPKSEAEAYRSFLKKLLKQYK